jgi:hypothetical protein
MVKASRSIVTVTAALLGLIAPMSAMAYLSPEDVFGSSTYTPASSSTPAQVNQRNGEDVVAAQQRSAAASRSAAQASFGKEEVPVDDYVPPAPEADKARNLLNDDTQYQLRQQRIQNERANGPTIIIGGNGDVVTADGRVLHSGAPIVSSTGPESTLAFAAVILAAVCTIGFAQYQSRKTNRAA